MGSVAWATAQQWCDIPSTKRDDWIRYDLEIQGYYGGRCEVFRTEVDSGDRTDRRSAYPAAMRECEFGWGRPRTTNDGRAAMRAYAAGMHGIYWGRVRVPAGQPLLPQRGKGRLVWATGTLEGAWTGLELRNAEKYGAKIEHLTAAHVYRETRRTYREYVDRLYGLREQALIDGDGPTSKWLKLLQNSLSGKLAQSPVVENVHVRAQPNEGWRWCGGDVWVSQFRQVSSSARPFDAATITSHARAVLLDRIMRAGDDVVYSDTDSVYSRTLDPDGIHPTRLGAWNHEGKMFDWLSLGPKIYTYTDSRGEGEAKCKGVPRPDRDTILALRDGETVRRDGGVAGVRSAGPRIFQARTVVRTRRSPPELAGTRRLLSPDRMTVAPVRSPEGVYSWPDVSSARAQELTKLCYM